MSLAELSKQWSCYEDLSCALSALEQDLIEAAHGESQTRLAAAISAETAGLNFATLLDVREHFAHRRDHLESWAVLGMFLSCEGELRFDMESRWKGERTSDHPLHDALVALKPDDPKKVVGIKRLLTVWAKHHPADSRLFDRLESARIYRNWLAHGAYVQCPLRVPLSAATFYEDAEHTAELLESFVNR